MSSTISAPSLASIRDMLANVWTDVLGVKVAPGDDFFALGGDSVAAVQVMLPISQLIGTDVPPTLIYAHTTLEQLAVEVARLLSESRGQ
jgi:nonribosomal peptide synthetase MxcG